MKYGVDVASRRQDDLDKHVEDFVVRMSAPKVLELGCGSGQFATRLVRQGAIVAATDIRAHEAWKQMASGHSQLTFTECDMRALPPVLLNTQYDCVVIQRTLHYIPYTDARALLTSLKKCVTSKLYISITGTETVIAKYHPGVHKPLDERFSPLTPAGQDLFSITAPICLYSQAELNDLLEKADFKVEEIWTSAFGNHKAICS